MLKKHLKSNAYIVSVVLCAILLIAFVALCSNAASADKNSTGSTDGNADISEAQPVISSFIKAYKLEIDGVFIAYADSESVFDGALEQVLAAKSAALSLSSLDGCVITNDISVTVAQCKENECLSEREVAALLGVREGSGYRFEVHNAYSETTSLSIDILRETLTVEETEIAYGTVYNDILNAKTEYTTVLENGTNGVLQTTYHTVSINGVEISKEKVSETTVTEPKDEIIERGIVKDTPLYTLSLARFQTPYVGRISSDYGYRYIFGGREFHYGIDLVAYSGSCYGHDITAAGTGIVIATGYSGGYGNRIIIEHSDGYKTLYAHLSEINCKVGDVVFVGQPIGKIGKTGRVTGAHLHFEVRENDVKVNPNYYLFNY